MMRRMLFWGSMGLILHTYLGFPILLLIRGLLRRHPVRKSDVTPRVSMVIVAHNEAAVIGSKLDNMLALEYPRDKLEIIVASDGSDDGTNEIIASYARYGVRLLAFPRQGKIPALNAAVAQATGEILVFSDANSMYAPDALSTLVRPFADPSVGAVGGNQCYLSDSGGNAASFGERLYWGFDRKLKTMQGEAGNATAATGAIHAIRRDLFQSVPLGVNDDFVISTQAIMQGYRLVFEPHAIAYETIAPTDNMEFQRKVRVIVRGLRGLWVTKQLFNPLRFGFYSFQLFSHKLLRWSIGWLLIVLLGASLSLYRTGRFYKLVTQGQIGLYGCALGAFILRHTSLVHFRAFKLLAIPFYFCLVNIATLQAWVQLLRGKRIDVWNSNRHVIEVRSLAPLQYDVPMTSGVVSTSEEAAETQVYAVNARVVGQ